MTNIEFPNNVTKIGFESFAANQLENIKIGSMMTNIEPRAFYKNPTSNPKLTTIYNNTSKSFDWGLIINGTSGYNFVSGKVENSVDPVQVIAGN